nr:HEAT repeat domain-containing protein [Candidatus Eremiobacteraeota bacterium]
MLSLLTVTLSPSGQRQRAIVTFESERSLGSGRLASYLQSADHSLAVRAALGIGRTKQLGGVDLLAPYLRDRDPGLRAMVVYALGLIGIARNGPQISRALAHDH